MTQTKRNVSITSQLVTLTDGGGFEKVLRTSDIVSTMTTLNRFFDTTFIDPGLKFLSCDYHVGNKLRCDVLVEVLPSRRQLTDDLPTMLMPWLSIAFTLEAPVTAPSKISVVTDSVAFYLSPTQIYNVLTTVYVPSFINDLNEFGIVCSEKFYEALNAQNVAFPARLSSVVNKIFAAARLLTYDPNHSDFIKMAEVQTSNGYTVDLDPKSAGQAKFLFDFSFLPNFELYDVINRFGSKTATIDPEANLYEFLLSKSKD
jgi:hypothetical protein